MGILLLTSTIGDEMGCDHQALMEVHMSKSSSTSIFVSLFIHFALRFGLTAFGSIGVDTVQSFSWRCTGRFFPYFRRPLVPR